MVGLIENKVSLANRRAEMVKAILTELVKSNSQFKSARKLSEYLAIKMAEHGEHIDSSTLRRAGSHYKTLIDDYIAAGSSKKVAAKNMKKDLKLRQQNKLITDLESKLVEKTAELAEKEDEIKLLLVDMREVRSKAVATMQPPQAETYTRSELSELRSQLKKNERQLDKACHVIETLMNELDGTYEITSEKVIDSVTEEELFNRNDFESYFSYISDRRKP
ncbi:hypothetical protein [Vibrio brasiliensis]|uniref:Uncharacterized protein n=1 Tax=Vibrio brasiliensis LMG 20546 TaxID=945543 RepID=E8LYQ4_9VIBR|nr:hypothetical protein [Vibrio brasiliensis]EGA64168.1 hypothetical protein VIBR0546_02489 [Vibrio brasiliensis LMG 20546]